MNFISIHKTADMGQVSGLLFTALYILFYNKKDCLKVLRFEGKNGVLLLWHRQK